LKITMPDSIQITSSNEPFKYAINLLNSIKIPTKEVYKKLIFIYEKLGQKENADQVRKNQKEAQREYLSKIKQKQILNQILKKIDFEKIFNSEFELWYLTELNHKYTPENSEQFRDSDSLIEWKFNIVTKDLIQSHPEADTLNRNSIDQLTEKIHQLLYTKIKNKLAEIESDYFYQKIQESFKNKEYQKVVFLIESFDTVIKLKEKTAELSEMKIESKKKIRMQEIKAKSRKRLEKKSIKQSEAENNTLNEQVDTIQQTATTIPLYKQIGVLIDELVGKGDYIGAYRGLRAYEKLLKDNFSEEEIDKTIKNIENVIEKKYGRGHLKKLKKELQ
ncbi:MAG: hypothetical protein PVI26_11255, partial [Chitinispirillia bacterium]